jgi:hypothetical protein
MFTVWSEQQKKELPVPGSPVPNSISSSGCGWGQVSGRSRVQRGERRRHNEKLHQTCHG